MSRFALNVARTSLRVLTTRVSSCTLSVRGVSDHTNALTSPNYVQKNRAEIMDSILDDKLPKGKPKGRILEDMLLILNNKNAEETLEFVQKFSPLLDSHHIYLCYGNIRRYLLHDEPEIRGNTVRNMNEDDRFQQLCILAGKKARYFEPKHCAYMVRNLRELGFTSHSVLMQIFLELCKHHVNDLNLNMITLLGQNLLKLKPTSQTVLLKQVLALAVNNTYHTELRYLSTDMLIDMFQAFAVDVSPDIQNSMIWNLKIRTNSWKFNKPEIVLDTLRRADILDKDLIIECCALSLVCFERQLFDTNQVETLLNSLSHFKWYSQDIFTVAVDYLSSKDLPWPAQARMASLLMQCHYFPTKLVDKLISNLNHEDEIDIESREILDQIVSEAEGLPGIDSDAIRRKFNLFWPPMFKFPTKNFLTNMLEKRVDFDTYDVMLLVVGIDDYFRNVSKLRGPWYRAVMESRIKDGRKVCVVAKPYWLALPEKERFDVLKRCVDEASRNGYAQLM